MCHAEYILSHSALLVHYKFAEFGDKCNFLFAVMCYDGRMDKDKLIKGLLDDKRTELIWALSLQKYTQSDIAYILRDADISTVSRTIAKMPTDYQPKWIKK